MGSFGRNELLVVVALGAFARCLFRPGGLARWPLAVIASLVTLPFCFETIYVRFASKSSSWKGTEGEAKADSTEEEGKAEDMNRELVK